MDNLKWGLFALNVPRQVSEDALLAKVRQVRPQMVATTPQVSRQLQVRSSPPGCGRRRSEGGVAAGEAAAHQPRLSMAATTLVKARPRREMHALLHQRARTRNQIQTELKTQTPTGS